MASQWGSRSRTSLGERYTHERDLVIRVVTGQAE